MLREALFARTFVELADTLVDDFDVVDMLTVLADRCVEVFDADAAGIMIANGNGDLRVLASSSESMRVLELLELDAGEGPCPECYRTGEAIVRSQLSADAERWPSFVPSALKAGFQSAHAIPMRLRGQTIGALDLFRNHEGSLDEADLIGAQAFADVATIALLQHRAVTDAQTLTQQLSHALDSRVIIEQAKGIASERGGLTMEQSFAQMRGHARNHNLRLLAVAQEVIDGHTPWSDQP